MLNAWMLGFFAFAKLNNRYFWQIINATLSDITHPSTWHTCEYHTAWLSHYVQPYTTESNLFMHVTTSQALTERPFALTAVDAAVLLAHVSSYFWEQADNTQCTSDLKVRSVIMSGGWRRRPGRAGGWWQQKQHWAKQPDLSKCFLMWFYYITELAHGSSTAHCVQENKSQRLASDKTIYLQFKNSWIALEGPCNFLYLLVSYITDRW